jgi:hypothetical protein
MNNGERQVYEFESFALDEQGRVLLLEGSVVPPDAQGTRRAADPGAQFGTGSRFES